jgi:hypothetical protein
VNQQQKIIVTNKHGEKLVGLLHDTGSGDIVILCHGFGSTKVRLFFILELSFSFIDNCSLKFLINKLVISI